MFRAEDKDLITSIETPDANTVVITLARPQAPFLKNIAMAVFGIASPAAFETLGENISELTRHVFDTVSIPNFYKNVLRKLSKTVSYNDVCALFENNLSFNAKAFLLAQYGEDQ